MAITGGITLLQKLQKLYGARAVTDRLGVTTNVQTLAQGTNNPFALEFSKKYLKKNPDGVEEASRVIMENMQFAFGNKNAQQMKNFEANVNTLYDMKFPPAKAEAEILDLSTKKQVTGKGIDYLKNKMGLPEGVEPNSPLGKIVTSQNRAKKYSENQARQYSANIESYRRPIIRQMLLKDTRINLPDNVRKSLESKMDLSRGSDPKMDPLRLLNEYYDVDFAKLDELEDIRFTARNETEAANEFLKKGGLKPKKPIVRESLDDEAVEMAEQSDLDDDIPFAQGGRAGFSVGGLARLLKFLQKFKKKKTQSQLFEEDMAKIKELMEIENKKFYEGLKPGGTLEQNIEKATGYQFPDVDEIKRVLKQKLGNKKDNVLKEFDVKGRKPNADGGIAGQLHLNRTGYDIGGAAGTKLAITQALKDFKRYQKAGGKLNYKKFIASGKEGVSRFFNQGGRVGLEKGGPPNKGRRNFMKLMAGLASIPVLGKFFKGAKVASKIPMLKNTSTVMPAWFPDLVDKFVAKGVAKKIDEDIIQYEIKELPGIKMTKHDDGRIYVEGENDYSRGYDIEYQPPGYEVVDYKTGKAVKTKGDFTASEEVPVNADMDGNIDFEGEILEEVGDILTSDGRTMEEFATGTKLKTSTRGEHRVGQAEVAAENAADDAAERAAMEADDFAKGGLAGQLKL